MSEARSNDQRAGFVTVTQAQFFAVIGPLDVTPYPRGQYPYVSEWTTPSHQVLGISTEDTYQLRADLVRETT